MQHPTGVYTGNLTLRGEGGWTRQVPITVTVHNVTIPPQQGTKALTFWGDQITEWEAAYQNMQPTAEDTADRTPVHFGEAGSSTSARPGTTGGNFSKVCNDSGFADLLRSHRLPAASSIYSGCVSFRVRVRVRVRVRACIAVHASACVVARGSLHSVLQPSCFTASAAAIWAYLLRALLHTTIRLGRTHTHTHTHPCCPITATQAVGIVHRRR